MQNPLPPLYFLAFRARAGARAGARGRARAHPRGKYTSLSTGQARPGTHPGPARAGNGAQGGSKFAGLGKKRGARARSGNFDIFWKKNKKIFLDPENRPLGVVKVVKKRGARA